jgi:hypothetical protein
VRLGACLGFFKNTNVAAQRSFPPLLGSQVKSYS